MDKRLLIGEKSTGDRQEKIAVLGRDKALEQSVCNRGLEKIKKIFKRHHERLINDSYETDSEVS